MHLRNFFRNEEGQELAEYALIIGFIALIGIAVFASSGGSVPRIWTTASSIATSADALLKGGPASVSTAQH